MNALPICYTHYITHSHGKGEESDYLTTNGGPQIESVKTSVKSLKR